MADEWRETSLGDLVTFLSGGTPSKEKATYWNGSVPWASAKDMKRLFLDDTEDHVTEEGIKNGTKCVPANTVLLLTRGMTLLNDVPICIVRRPMTFNQDVKALRPKDGIKVEFLPYLVLGNKHRLLSLVDLAGHGTGRLNTDELKSLEVLVPPESEQLAIAHILGSLDEKIELSRRMNDMLQAMARVLFESWFVDFEQADAKVRRDGRVEELLTLSRDTINPSAFPAESFEHYSIPAFDDRREPKTELSGEIKSNKFLVPQNAVLLSKLNPRFPRVWLPNASDTCRPICSTEFLVAIPREGVSREYLYGLFTSSAFSEVFASLVTGTSGSHQRVKPDYLLAMAAVIPPREAIRRYTEFAKPLHERIALNLKECRTLAGLRDTLLPRLISGELRIPVAEKLVDGAI